MQLIRPQTQEQMDEARVLFREYAQFLAVDLCFQDFENELAGLPGKYAPPEGALFIAIDGPAAAGCVALRRLEDGVCEVKRLFVRPAWRGQGLGRVLARRALDEAVALGYRVMRLDTLERLTEAMRLYQSFGFRRCSPYYPNPLPSVVYWEIHLTQSGLFKEAL